ncbi:Origin recognition complex subunit 6 [Pseudolycoriella hygida]|uniref:Origin recognition complex subunit 6 n=1 Tax=Pseudolycoriella hygida TaxID=35572 RepID=A0A9Q0MLJ8_9DIPT|nr:Origin recognition complex subunit 6 [Pseudolycoriella hygida]
MDLVKDVSKKLDIDDKKVIDKASEHLRLLQVKNSNLQITEYARIVICLDIAASHTDTAFNQGAAFQLLGYGKEKYRKEKNIILRVLNVNQVHDIRTICQSIKAINSQELEENATKMLKDFKVSKDVTDAHPQYDAMAVYQTSKMMKIKVNEEKLIDASHLKRMQWTNLKNQWHRWLEENKITLKNFSRKRNANNGSANEVDTVEETKENINPKVKCTEASESYEDWKKRILAKAHADLKNS